MPTRDTPWPAGTPCWIDLSAPDVPAAAEFYGSLFGWTYLDTGAEFGNYHIARVNGRAPAAIGPQFEEGQPAAWTLYLASDDVDATAKLIADNGGNLLMEPGDVGAKGRMLIASDPTGAVFGVWQAGETTGLQVFNEPGALAWEDARLTDAEAGRRFYASVFGYTYGPVEGAPPAYRTFEVDGRPVGGIGDLTGAPEGTPSHWVGYFSVADVDAAVATAERGGGRVLGPAQDTPFGRMAELADPFGATFMVHAELA